MTEPRQAPFLSVIIPTKNRAATLATTLAALAEQQQVVGGTEIIVADNGSTDETPQTLADAAQRLPALVAVRQPKPGPAAARNAAVAVASGTILLLLGDDTVPVRSDLLASHAALHRERPDPTFACLGRLHWVPEPPPSDFMHWLDNGGPQFHYFELQPGPVDPSRYFYSSHLSLKRNLFEHVGGFDERFPYAAVEDTELGVRLRDAGMVLDFHPELVIHHDHPTTPAQSLRRSIVVGRSAALYNQIRRDRPHPDVREPHGPAWALLRVGAPILGVAARLPLPRCMRERVWRAMTLSGYAKGFRLQQREVK
jgi:glycosyltransferase involved in cell wall biosynthesis